MAGELGTGDASAFMSVGFSHHMAIIRVCKSSDERLFYIRKAASEFWSYRVLLQHDGLRPSAHPHVAAPPREMRRDIAQETLALLKDYRSGSAPC